MGIDVLVTQGARATAAVIFTMVNGINSVPVRLVSGSKASIHSAVGRLASRFSYDPKPWDMGPELLDRSDILQASQQQFCRDVCQISERYNRCNIGCWSLYNIRSTADYAIHTYEARLEGRKVTCICDRTLGHSVICRHMSVYIRGSQ